MFARDRSAQGGQVLALFALGLTTIILGAAIVVDGGYAFAQRRASQNAADFAAMAGTRIVGQKLTGNPPGSGTATNVRDAIDAVLDANNAILVSAEYVDDEGLALGDVYTLTSIPNDAFGVVVEARIDWQPFLLGVIGITDWAANASATAITPGQSIGGGMMPLGIEDTRFDSLVECPLDDLDTCIDQNLTGGHLNIPGGFGWLKFGLDGHCDFAPSLGMNEGGCESSKTFLDEQIGPPGNAYGCCTAVGLPGSTDLIGSLTGNEWGDLSFYIDNRIPVWVPIWDDADPPQCSNGANACYHIVGFGAIIITGQNEHAKWLEGAAIEVPCAVPPHKYCSAPGGSFTIDVTGEVRLVR
jgi:hypothetical protein